jgi:hypothetical protein
MDNTWWATQPILPLPRIERLTSDLVTTLTELRHPFLSYPTNDLDTPDIRFPTVSFSYNIATTSEILYKKKCISFVIFQHPIYGRNMHTFRY